MHPLVKLQNVGVRYHQRVGSGRRRPHVALRDVSFDVFSGDSLGVIGRNGAGKSTLLRVLAGIIKPDRGTIAFTGCRVGLLSLQLGFDPDLSGRENAIIGGMLLGISRREVKSRLDEIIGFSELEAVIDDPLRTYSTGMRARLGFSVALQMRPDVLLIDEVLGVGDAAFSAKASAAIEQVIRSDRTVVLVSHSLSVVRSLCTRAVWIEDGVTRMWGAVDDVVTAYEQEVASQTAGDGHHRIGDPEPW